MKQIVYLLKAFYVLLRKFSQSVSSSLLRVNPHNSIHRYFSQNKIDFGDWLTISYKNIKMTKCYKIYFNEAIYVGLVKIICSLWLNLCIWMKCFLLQPTDKENFEKYYSSKEWKQVFPIMGLEDHNQIYWHLKQMNNRYMLKLYLCRYITHKRHLIPCPLDEIDSMTNGQHCSSLNCPLPSHNL